VKVLAIVADVSDEEAVKNYVKQTVKEFATKTCRGRINQTGSAWIRIGWNASWVMKTATSMDRLMKST